MYGVCFRVLTVNSKQTLDCCGFEMNNLGFILFVLAT